MANTYYLRCAEADVPELIRLGKLLGVLQESQDGDGVVRVVGSPGSSFDVIGPIYGPPVDTGKVGVDGVPIFTQGAPRADGQGRAYWHANLRTGVDLRATAETMAAENPDIAADLGNLPRFFITDAAGNVVPPAAPARVFL